MVSLVYKPGIVAMQSIKKYPLFRKKFNDDSNKLTLLTLDSFYQ